MRVLALNMSSGASAEVTDLFDAEASLHGIATDLAGVAFLPALGELVLLSQESKHLLRVSRDGSLVEPPFGLAGTQPEGIAFTADLASFFVASEPNELLRYDFAP
eukprot:5546086-Prymnesium_polylepis.2